MSFAASIRDFVNEMTEVNDRHTAFYNRKTGELITMNEQTRHLLDATASADPLTEGQQALYAAMQSGDLIELPGKYEQRLFATVEQFCESLKDRESRENLQQAIRGKKAFREFKRLVREMGLREQWTGFRNRAFEALIADWMSRHAIVLNKAA
jgi:hypothetical protein